ncbi:MAG: hypothetical protein J5I90_10150 [Caldilineales bacterium]|nr:hypothetical protein [Caldilineales bacterium]
MPIIKVEIGQYDYPFAGEFKFFEPGPDGRVVRPSVLIRLTDEDGLSGWGQAVPVPSWTYETVETVTSTLANHLAPKLLGADPADFVDIHRRMERAIRPGLTTGQPLCKAAVDLACFDLAGKQQGKSAGEFLSDKPGLSELTLSWTINATSLEAAEEQLASGYGRGYRNFNFKVGYPQTPMYDLALAELIHDFTPDGFCWADANTAYDLETALEVLPRLADAGVEVMESPLPPMDVAGYRALRQQGALPIVMDEGVIAPRDAETFMSLGMMDGLTLKIGRTAGLWNACQIASLAQKHGIFLLGSGLCDPDLSLAASAHVFARVGIDKPCALNGPQYLAETLDVSGFMPVSDQLVVPTGPGLGLRFNGRAEATLTIVAEAA